jgi:hypothetical protein
MANFEFPLGMLLEVIVTLGAAALAYALAPGEHAQRRRWCLATVAIAFAWHRVVALAIDHAGLPPPWPGVVPLVASVLVFLAAPIAIPLAVRREVMRRMPARWPPPDTAPRRDAMTGPMPRPRRSQRS